MFFSFIDPTIPPKYMIIALNFNAKRNTSKFAIFFTYPVTLWAENTEFTEFTEIAIINGQC